MLLKGNLYSSVKSLSLARFLYYMIVFDVYCAQVPQSKVPALSLFSTRRNCSRDGERDDITHACFIFLERSQSLQRWIW